MMSVAGRPTVVRALELGLLFVLYAATARLGLSFDALGGIASTVWPPTGIALAALSLRGRGALAGDRGRRLRRERHDGDSALERRDHRRRQHAGGSRRRRALAACGVRQPPRAAPGRVPARRRGGAREHDDQRHVRPPRRAARSRPDRRRVRRILGGLVGGRLSRRSADCPLPLRLGEHVAALAPPVSLVGGDGAGPARRAGERDGFSSRLRLAGAFTESCAAPIRRCRC